MFEEFEEQEASVNQDQQKVEDKADRRFYRHERENRFLVKRSEDYSVFDDVFNIPTLMVVNSLIKNNILIHLKGALAAGKESKVYLGVGKNNEFRAVKIYLTISAEFKKRLQYIAGDPRFSDIKKGSRNFISVWAKKEFKNLKTAHKNGINVPAPHEVRRNILVMDFIGDDEGNPAPDLLHSKSVTSKDYDE